MLGTKIKFEGVKGVGTVELDLQEDQRVYTLIGANGVGKTKTLEALFQVLFFSNSSVSGSSNRHLPNRSLRKKNWVFREGFSSGYRFNLVEQTSPSPSLITALSVLSEHGPLEKRNTLKFTNTNSFLKHFDEHLLPIVYVAAQNRGFIDHNPDSGAGGSFDQRKSDYLNSVIEGMESNFSSLNMGNNIESWFVALAQSSNRFQKKSDNREVEINTILKLLNKLDDRIDPNDLEIDGSGRVSLTVDGQLRELSHLSTGFASMVKIIQTIVSGYGSFTNENHLEHVKGIVLVDEIESHLHLAWQANIIPLLKQLFPNTIFYITTHSSIVLSQLQEGEAYRLERQDDGVVRTNLIKRPNKASFVDVLKDAFGVDVNKLKRDNMSAESQKAAKQQLLDLLNEEDSV